MNALKWIKGKNRQRLLMQRRIIFRLYKRIVKPNKLVFNWGGNVRRILIWNYEGIGDAIVSSGFINELKAHGFDVSVCSSLRNIKFCSEVLGIKRCYSFNEVSKINNDFDLILVVKDKFEEREGVQILKLYRKTHAKYIIGFDDPLKLNDLTLDCMHDKHVTKKFAQVLEYLGIKEYDLSYKIDVLKNYEDEVLKFISQFKDKKIVCLNAFAGDERRSFSIEQVEKITKYISYYEDTVVILIGSQEQMKKLSVIKQSNIFLTPVSLGRISHAVALIRFADLVITPDTSVVHMANAYNKKMISVYNNRKEDGDVDINVVWGPNYTNCVQLFTKDDWGMKEGDYISRYDVTEMFPYIDHFLKL